MGSISKSSPLHRLLPPVLLLLLFPLFGQFSNAALFSEGVDELGASATRASLSRTLKSSPPSSLSSSILSFAELVKDDIDELIEGREEEVLSCITNNIDPALTQAKITREKINDFKENYTKNKYNTTWAEFSNIIPAERDNLFLEVCNVDQSCSKVLPSLPPATTPPPTSNSDAARALSEISSHTLRFMYAYEQLLLDQAMNEDKFAKDMHDAYVNHNQLSTLLEGVLEECGVEGDFDVAALQGKMYVTTSTPHTDLRGFCTLRQSLQGLDLLESMFGEGVRRLEKVVVAERENEEENEEDEEEEEEVVQRRNKKKTAKGGRSGRHGKNKKGNKRRNRRRNYLD